MTDSVRLTNFKCFREQEFSLNGLTILAGMNGSGKSSMVQAILAMHQCATSGGRPWRGPLVDLGSFRDVLHDGAAKDEIRIEMETRGMKSCILESPDNGVELRSGDEDKLIEFGDVHFVSADRLGPRRTLPYIEGRRTSRAPLGIRGEHVLQYLDALGGESVAAGVRHSTESKKTLLAQTNAWLRVICPGVEMGVKVVPEADCAIAGFRFRTPTDIPSRTFRAGNVGFGVSYALAPIVALLAPRKRQDAEDGYLAVIENPEAHVHPAGQVALARLAVKAVASGSQVILETHSDHILNGVRLAVADGLLPPDRVVVHYFEREGIDVRVTTLSVGRNGRLDMWPQGFFDQHERTLSRLVGLAV